MRMYKVLTSKRKALGLTQSEIGELAGVTNSTVSNFEAGEEVSIPVFNSIKMAIENQFAALGRLEYMEAMLKMHTIQLGDLEGEEKIICLGYISIYSNKLQMELLRVDKKRLIKKSGPRNKGSFFYFLYAKITLHIMQRKEC